MNFETKSIINIKITNNLNNKKSYLVMWAANSVRTTKSGHQKQSRGWKTKQTHMKAESKTTVIKQKDY